MALLDRGVFPYVVIIAGLTFKLVPRIVGSLDHAEKAAWAFAYINSILCVVASRRRNLSELGSEEERRALLAAMLHFMAVFLALCWMLPFLLLSFPVAALTLGWLYKKGAFDEEQ